MFQNHQLSSLRWWIKQIVRINPTQTPIITTESSNCIKSSMAANGNVRLQTMTKKTKDAKRTRTIFKWQQHFDTTLQSYTWDWRNAKLCTWKIPDTFLNRRPPVMSDNLNLKSNFLNQLQLKLHKEADLQKLPHSAEKKNTSSCKLMTDQGIDSSLF